VTYYYEDSMTFIPINMGDQFGRMGGGITGFPENGTAYLILGAFDSLSGSRGGVSRFGLHSVDLAEFSTLYSLPKTVRFIGYRFDGDVVEADFTTDGVIDGKGPAADFETFYFDNRFSDLVRFEVPTHTYALDNLVFSGVVPEPSTLALLIVGASLAGFGFFKRRRRSPSAAARVGSITATTSTPCRSRIPTMTG
jgi:hypothetical protein